MKIQVITLLLATLTTGLMAGIFFIWTNTIKPGIGKLNDFEYLKSFQSMNRVILNPLFYMVFMVAVFLTPLAAILSYEITPKNIFWLLVIATVIYWTGCFLVTFLGNIPLNNLLDKTNIQDISIENARSLRLTIEEKWNFLNLIRTITSIISFLLLIISCITR